MNSTVIWLCVGRRTVLSQIEAGNVNDASEPVVTLTGLVAEAAQFAETSV
ncbi:MAG: hypothetical protein R2850_06305 [Bacteroidia bacterium]